MAIRTLLILGASGDLTARLLLPALGQLLCREPERKVHIIGTDVQEMSNEAWRERIRNSFRTTDSEDAFDKIKDTRHIQADITDAEGLTRLLSQVEAPISIYFAVPPGIAVKACEALADVELPEGTMLALEKPFGTNEAGARALNRTLDKLVPEEQIFRVDHFLGNTMLLNVLGVRLSNRLLEPLWSSDHIESVSILYNETLGLEGRAGYYDKAGALVDMIQSHLLQVLAIVAMEPPAALNEVDLRSATATVLRATRVWQADPQNYSRRARYLAGEIDGRALPNYVDEPGVDPSRNTETLAEATFEIRNTRWTGVPFTVRSGKALDQPAREIVIRFKPAHHLPDGLRGDPEGAILRFALGPDSVSLEINASSVKDPLEMERAVLTTHLGEGALKAYTEVLAGILEGDPLLSVRSDAAEQCWHIVDPILQAWRDGSVPLEEYEAGSLRPEGWPQLR